MRAEGEPRERRWAVGRRCSKFVQGSSYKAFGQRTGKRGPGYIKIKLRYQRKRDGDETFFARSTIRLPTE